MLTKIKNRVNSDRADANSVSQILWIAIAAAVISVVGLAIFNAIKAKGTEVSNQITNTKNTFK
jgi:Ni,Fe-hydrogenase I cytochrome b subunit